MTKIIKHFLPAAFLLLSFCTAAAVTLSPQAEIRVMTMGPYQGELYSAFGHSAFRVKDPAQNLDIVYNYGSFDMKQEDFYLNFIRGKMLYKLGTAPYKRFRDYYIRNNRYIYEQVLNLTQEEKQVLFDFLRNNSKPENRNYLYNYVYDNCASKIPDVIEAALRQELVLDTTHVTQGTTIRQLMDNYTGQQQWGDFGIDLGLSLQIDKVADARTYLFLPDYVYASFARSGLKDREGNVKPLVKETEIVYQAREETPERKLLTPFNFFVLLFFVFGFVTNINFKKGKRSRWIDTLLFGFAGLAGLLLLFLWLGTDHLSAWNLNLLWALPSHLVAVFLVNKQKYRKPMRTYFKYVSIFNALLIVVWTLLPQELPVALVPFVLIMVLRGFYIVYDLRK